MVSQTVSWQARSHSMFLRDWQQWLTRKFQRPRSGGQTGRRKKAHPRLVLEQLEQRLAPVVGAFAVPVPILAPSPYDGVVEIIAPGHQVGTGALLFDGLHILTAAHVVDTPPPPPSTREPGDG